MLDFVFLLPKEGELLFVTIFKCFMFCCIDIFLFARSFIYIFPLLFGIKSYMFSCIDTMNVKASSSLSIK
ncbi:hypothetical protein JHK85_015995 [Glycine max]|nr:hypothetical protein JHK85_015995 [Glycine max]